MNKRLLNSRFYQILAVMIVLVLILCVRLFVLTVIQKDEWTTAAENQNTKEITTLACSAVKSSGYPLSSSHSLFSSSKVYL